MKIYKYKEDRLLDPYERIDISKWFNRYIDEIGASFSYINASEGYKIKFQQYWYDNRIEIRLLINIVFMSFRNEHPVHIKTRNYHINPFWHNNVFSEGIYEVMRQDILYKQLLIPLGRIRVRKFKGKYK